ncbi:MAG: hypothetical protein SFZ24_00500 [Planctomycetota bacterium]|nr:hypothetical protein [Planctomycetota bacterium]
MNTIPRLTPPQTPRPARRRAFALLDVLLAAALLAILAALAIPSLRPNDSLKMVSAAVLISADLEYAQSATIAAPGDPTVFRLDEKLPRYWLALASSPDTPITRPDGAPWLVTLGSGSLASLNELSLRLEGVAGTTVAFDRFGRLNQGDDIRVIIESQAGELPVRISASTGSVYMGE